MWLYESFIAKTCMQPTKTAHTQECPLPALCFRLSRKALIMYAYAGPRWYNMPQQNVASESKLFQKKLCTPQVSAVLFNQTSFQSYKTLPNLLLSPWKKAKATCHVDQWKLADARKLVLLACVQWLGKAHSQSCRFPNSQVCLGEKIFRSWFLQA